MVVVVLVVLMVVVAVVCLEAVEVDCYGAVCFIVEGDIFELGVVLLLVVMEMELDNFELVAQCVVRLVLWCSNGREHFL